MTNSVRIDIEVTENARKATEAGERIRRPLVVAATDIDRAFDKTAKQLANTLDKIEQDAWKAGKGTDQAFGTAMSGLRKSLDLVREEAGQTGQGLRSSMGDALTEVRKSAEQLADSIKPVATATIPVNANWEKTGRLISTELDRIERDAWESGRMVDKSFARTLAEVREDFERIRAEGKKTGASLESELGESLLSIKQQMNDIRELGQSGMGAPSGGAGGGGLASSMLGDLGSVKGAALAAGAAAGKFLWEGFQAEWKEDAVGGLLAAQTGTASTAAEGLGDTAGEVFASNFGSSIEEVGQAMASVFENKLIDTDAPAAAIKDITERVMTLSTVMGEGFDRISFSAKQMVKNGIAGSVTQAMDLIGEAQERGLNASGDLLDTIDEYSTKFRDLGLNGQQALGLIQQMMEGGARNTDIAADALKEFAIRAQDGSVLTRRGFEAIGLDADKMGKMIAAGGESARLALDQTLDALQAMPPGIERSTAAVDLFGTKAEDLGAALYSMDLDSATKDFENFGGTVDDMMRKIDESTSTWDKLGRGISTATAKTGEFLDNFFSAQSFSESGLGKMMQELQLAKNQMSSTGDTAWLDDLKEKYPSLTGIIDDFIQKKRSEKSANEEATSSVEDYVETLDKMISKQREAATGVIDLSDAQIGYQEAIAEANASIEENKKNLDLATEGGRENQGVLNGLADRTWTLIDAMVQQGATVDQVRGFMGTARDQFIATATSMGMSADQARALADKLKLIPGNYNASIHADTGAASSALRGFQRLLNSIFGRTYNVAVNAIGAAASAMGHAHGGNVGMGVWAAASGGQRHSSTLMNEAGPEVVDLPTGSRVATAGATRALAEMGAFSGGGGPTQVLVSWAGAPDAIRGILEGLRIEIKNNHGGSVTAALGQRGA